MIRVSPTITIDERDVEEVFIRSSGPGGQNVNKVATAVQLRFDVRHSRALSEDIRQRLQRLAGRRMTRDGVLIIMAQKYRTQERNRQDALDRFIALIKEAETPSATRRPTRPTVASRERRLKHKRRRSAVKGLRANKPSLD
jgi:ribosome-associated protein